MPSGTLFYVCINKGTVIGDWIGDFIHEVVLGRYGDDMASIEFPSVQYDGSFVSSSWDPGNIANAAFHAGIDRLYLDVIKPTCMVCHTRQGKALGSFRGEGSELDYNTILSWIIEGSLEK